MDLMKLYEKVKFRGTQSDYKKGIKYLLLMGAMFLGVVFRVNYCMAKEYSLKNNETKRVVVNSSDDEYTTTVVPKSSCSYTVKITNIKVSINGQNSDEACKYVIVDDVYDTGKDYYVRNSMITFKKNGNEDLNSRQYLIELDMINSPYSSLDEYIISCDVTAVVNEVAKLTKSKVTCYLDNTEGRKIELRYASEKVKWKISNKKVATIYTDGSSVIIYPKKIGVCYLTGKCAGKTYKCKVTIKGRKYVYVGRTLDSYNSRSNIYTMRIKNCSYKSIKIKATGAVAVDSDYTNFDRNLKLKKTVSIKPGQEKKVKFKVIGSITWHDVNDFCINYTILYKKKKYRMASDVETTWIRRKGNWKELLTYDEIGSL